MKTTEEWMAETMQPIFDRMAGGPMDETEVRARMAKHTPGPWTATFSNREECLPADIKYRPSRVIIGERELHISDVILHDADARLIAAAPDLLEALIWYVENDDVNIGQEGNEPYEAGLRRAQAAIAKATGANNG